jgi:hypothetical protein
MKDRNKINNAPAKLRGNLDVRQETEQLTQEPTFTVVDKKATIGSELPDPPSSATGVGLHVENLGGSHMWTHGNPTPALPLGVTTFTTSDSQVLSVAGPNATLNADGTVRIRTNGLYLCAGDRLQNMMGFPMGRVEVLRQNDQLKFDRTAEFGKGHLILLAYLRDFL